jgi:fimbrial chaperone protein
MAIRMVFFLLLASLICTFFLLPDSARGGEFRVTPIRLALDARTKTGVITVTNEAEEKLQCQMKAFEWTQDEGGKDVYEETQDLVFFPKIMTVDPKSERVIRAGIKIPVVAKEKTYRLFIEEIPEPKKAQGTAVAVAIRFGVPIFSQPVKEEAKGAIERFDLSKGTVTLALKNTGNVHLVITRVRLLGWDQKGGQTLAKDLSGWYLLNGVSRTYSAPLARDACTKTATLDVEVVTDKINLKHKLNTDASMCK